MLACLWGEGAIEISALLVQQGHTYHPVHLLVLHNNCCTYNRSGLCCVLKQPEERSSPQFIMWALCEAGEDLGSALSKINILLYLGRQLQTENHGNGGLHFKLSLQSPITFIVKDSEQW